MSSSHITTELFPLFRPESVAVIGATNNRVQDSSADFGQRITEAIVDAVQQRVEAFLAHPERYIGHGAPV